MTGTQDLAPPDFFSDPAVAQDPQPYYEELRKRGPVWREPHHGVVVVSGYEEVVAVGTDPERFSACNSVTGPFPGLPVAPEGDDANPVIAQCRGSLPMSEYMVTMDPPMHTRHRALLGRLLTPRRLQENEEFMWRLADSRLDALLANGRVEFFHEYGKAYATDVVSDLLGVPEEDHRRLRLFLGVDEPGVLGDEAGMGHDPLAALNDAFSAYIEDRRREPRQDALTHLAATTFPDGSIPAVIDVVRVATFLFAAGQDTSARLMTAVAGLLADDQELQERVRGDFGLINPLIEEMLRTQSPTKADFRMARKTTTLGGVEIPAGTTVMMLLGAANRDPREFEDPDTFRLGRPDVQHHVAFGRGPHACPGASLARAETRITLQRLLERTSHFSLDAEHHGPAGARRYTYDPTYLLRGLAQLHLDLQPATSATAVGGQA